MFFFLLTVIPLVLLKPPTLWPLPVPSLMNEIKLLAFLLCKEFFNFSIQWLKTTTISLISTLKLLHQMPASKKLIRVSTAEQENAGGDHRTTYSPVLLDLPELALETVLQRLPPSGLYSMSAVTRSLRERCTSDHLWERHMEEKWGQVLGEAAHREWKRYVAASRRSDCSSSPAVSSSSSTEGKVPGWAGLLLSCVWPLQWLARSSKNDACHDNSKTIQLAPDSLMSWFLELESGRFWFPAQVYNREQNGHIGFLLSCYDAQVSYDNLTDTFHARYLPHGRRATIIEDGISWDRLRMPPVATPPHNLHISDCLSDLQPGDHVEIQWRRTKEFPYGWWYGVVGHLESCDRTEHTCNCHKSDTVIIEFRQYAPGSQWRHATVCRKDHQEQGNEADGFYGGIRKIKNKDEISGWRKFFPPEMLE